MQTNNINATPVAAKTFDAMKFEVYQEKLLQLQQLIKSGKTGPPKELAKRLGVSERTARRFVERLKQEQPNILYSRSVNSYIEGNDDEIG